MWSFLKLFPWQTFLPRYSDYAASLVFALGVLAVYPSLLLVIPAIVVAFLTLALASSTSPKLQALCALLESVFGFLCATRLALWSLDAAPTDQQAAFWLSVASFVVFVATLFLSFSRLGRSMRLAAAALSITDDDPDTFADLA